MRQRIRLAILECDTPLPETGKQYGGYGGVFKALLDAGAKAEGFSGADEILDISTHQIEANPDDYPDVNSVDALLLTGSSESLILSTGGPILTFPQNTTRLPTHHGSISSSIIPLTLLIRKKYESLAYVSVIRLWQGPWGSKSAGIQMAGRLP